MRAYVVSVMHAAKDAKALVLLQQRLNAFPRTGYPETKFTVRSAPAGRALAQDLVNTVLPVALLSPDFFASSWADDYPMAARLVARYGKTIMPILLRPCGNLEEMGFRYFTIPRNGAISTYKDKDLAWNEVSTEIRSLFKAWYPGGL